jgi:hypothetical protein
MYVYISPFSNRFFKLSLIASLEILLIRVRSETPTSFFLVVSKTAFFANWDGGAPPPVSFLRPARFETCTWLQSVCSSSAMRMRHFTLGAMAGAQLLAQGRVSSPADAESVGAAKCEGAARVNAGGEGEGEDGWREVWPLVGWRVGV